MVEHAYIHIPFCIRKCKYCSFVSGENIKNKHKYIKSLLKEIKTLYNGEPLKTVYFGGGTPSLLDCEDIKSILSCFNLCQDCEITLEVNPETVSLNKFTDLRNIGINRISLGIQTFNDNILKLIGRGHTSIQAKNAVEIIKKSGFNNINTDLIYGLPYQTPNIFKSDLKQVLELDVEHISFYGLKIEEGAYFYTHKLKSLPDDEVQATMYNMLCDYLKDYEHYEISNFARYNYFSRHNCAYWQNEEYYGFGLNASGYQKNIRYKNVSDFYEYISNPFKREESFSLTKNETMENEIFLALRLKSGIDINKINKKYNIDFCSKYNKIIKKYSDEGFLILDSNLRLTRKGILLSNEIMSEFIDVD